MKYLSLFLILFLFAGSSSVSGQNYNFRKTTWGMDSAQVRSAESSRFVSSKKQQLLYTGKLGDWETEIVYNFTNTDHLYYGAYLINLDSRNPQTYVDAFLLLQQLLTRLYNTPNEKRYTTINGVVIDEGEWASHLMSGNLYLETRWSTPATKIMLTLTKVSDKLYLEVNYTSVEYEKLIDKKNREEILKEL